jgi:cytochrome c oxidase subunit II
MNATANTTGAVDQVFLLIIAVCIALFLLITVLMVGFVLRYRHSRHPKAEAVESSTRLEIAWTVIPTLIVMVMFWWGYKGFKILRSPPADAMVVNVTGRMWDWSFTYADGRTAKQLYVPVGKAVKLLLHSMDVVHSFYVPAFRIKEDVVPGRENYLWFKPETMGPADIFCSEYCGQNHAYMMSQVIVVSPEEFEKWLKRPEAPPSAGASVAEAGRKLAADKGCAVCHSGDGTKSIGPTFKGLFGSTVSVLEAGKEITVPADEAFLGKSIRDPESQLAKDYPNLMPLRKDLTEDEIRILVEYIKSLK